MSDWITTASEEVYKSAWFTLTEDKVTNAGGNELTYGYLTLAHPVVRIVAVNPDGRILIQSNYRYPLRSRVWEIPAGQTDGQDPLVAAKRELFEETGLKSSDWTKGSVTNVAAGIANIEQHLYIAKNVYGEPLAHDKDEDIINHTYHTKEDILKKIADGTINNSETIACLYQYIYANKGAL